MVFRLFVWIRPFSGLVAVMDVGLFWLVGGWLIHLGGGFTLLLEDWWGCVYFRDKPARALCIRTLKKLYFVTIGANNRGRKSK